MQGTGSGTDADPCHTTNCDVRYALSKGVCYGAGGAHGSWTCNVDEATCTAASGHHYPSTTLTGGCCMCEGGCPASLETGTNCAAGYGAVSNPYETTCKYTATIDPFAGPTGYFKFAECGDVANLSLIHI